ncbi:hotdog domain-containing protein [Colwellia sp.]
MRCVGLEMNTNHLKKMKYGKVIGTARPTHIDNTT